jgi:hypothetical protein
MLLLLLLLLVTTISSGSVINYKLSSQEYIDLLQREHSKGIWRAHNDSGLYSYRRRNLNDQALLTNMRIMVVCGMHAKEMVSTEVCADWMTLVDSIRPHQNWSYPQLDWLFVPIANPSGRDMVSEALVKLINTKEQGPGLCYRGNRRGTDINRNWPNVVDIREATLRAAKKLSREGPEAQAADYFLKGSYLRKNHGPLEEYAGVRPFSEVETAALRDMLYEFRPHMFVVIHSGTEAILVPYNSLRDEEPRNLRSLMRVANTLKPLDCDLCRIGRGSQYLYDANGTATDYAFEAVRVPLVYTLEVYVDAELDAAKEELTPLECLAQFNPLKEVGLTRVLDRWRRWPEELLLNLRDEDQVFISEILSNHSAVWPLR